MAVPIQNSPAELPDPDEVQEALRESATNRSPPPPRNLERRQKLYLGTYVFFLLALAIVLLLLEVRELGLPERFRLIARRFVLGAAGMTFVLAVSQAIQVLVLARLTDTVARYNLRRVLRLLTGLVLAVILISVVFANWYTAFVSLGLISLVLGFALQTPITSFIGWIYILVRKPYQVGDRIRIGEQKGDVIDVGYLDTTLWEFGGEYLTTDHPSGRIIKFPNSMVLSSPVYNYSWPLFPYIWNEATVQVAYDSDFEFVGRVLEETAIEELGEPMMERVKTFRDLLAQTPVDQLQVQERPVVFFRVGANTWIEATVRYLVFPKEAGRVKTRLLAKILARLNEAPERALFPAKNLR